MAGAIGCDCRPAYAAAISASSSISQFLPERPPLRCAILGVTWRSGGRESLTEIGKQSALGVLAVITEGLVDVSKEVQVRHTGRGALSDSFSFRDVRNRRKVLLDQRCREASVTQG